jgi:uncharacterized protein (DUF3084 family)
MTTPNQTSVINTLADGTKVLAKYITIAMPNGTKQVRSSTFTQDQISAQIASLQEDLALFTA